MVSSVAPPAQCSVRLGKNTAQLGTKETEDENMAEAKDKTFENCDSEGADAGGGVGDDDREENIRRRVD